MAINFTHSDFHAPQIQPRVTRHMFRLNYWRNDGISGTTPPIDKEWARMQYNPQDPAGLALRKVLAAYFNTFQNQNPCKKSLPTSN